MALDIHRKPKNKSRVRIRGAADPEKVLTQLYRRGLITVQREGNTIRFDLTPSGREYLQKVRITQRATRRLTNLVGRWVTRGE